MPNLVWSISANAPDLGLSNASYTRSPVPSFGTWHDLNQLLAVWAAHHNQSAGALHVAARRSSVSVADVPGLVPAYLAAVYARCCWVFVFLLLFCLFVGSLICLLYFLLPRARSQAVFDHFAHLGFEMGYLS